MTLIGPVVAPVGTIALIRVEVLTVKLALTPLNRTEVAPVKFVPLIFTLLPTEPLVGLKLVIVGVPILVGGGCAWVWPSAESPSGSGWV